MNQFRALGYLLFCGAAIAACGEVGEAEISLGERGQAIVRGQETDGFPQVVMLHVQRSTTRTRCSGTYIAPRLVLTAAHCVGAGAVPAASYVYFGEGQAPPADPMPAIPAPGEVSDLARVESFRVHPDYDPGVNHPDLAVVYLDRELPFAPLPLLRERLGRRSVGDSATIVGWVACARSSPISARSRAPASSAAVRSRCSAAPARPTSTRTIPTPACSIPASAPPR